MAITKIDRTTPLLYDFHGNKINTQEELDAGAAAEARNLAAYEARVAAQGSKVYKQSDAMFFMPGRPDTKDYVGKWRN